MMTSVDEAREVTLQFYHALDALLLGRGVQAMIDIWHHDDHVTTVHPFGHWARGWQEVLATWVEVGEVFSYYEGHRTRTDGIGTIHDLRVAVLGEAAYTTGIYKSLLYLPDGPRRLSVNCTNLCQKKDGVWKMIHHHPDQAPGDYQEAIGRLVR